jgi:hypothetical protein
METNFNPFNDFNQIKPESPKKNSIEIKSESPKKNKGNKYNPEISKKYFKNQNQNKNSIEYIIKNTNLSDKKKIELIKHLYLNINKESQIQIQEFIFYS